MKLIIINGPNLNLTGTREPEIYGTVSMDDYIAALRKEFADHQIDYFQSNIEGELINKLQEVDEHYDGVIINPGGYTHTSVAIADALAGIQIPTVEVHISNLSKREPVRQVSLTAPHCAGVISGFGLDSYRLALTFLTNR